MHANDNTLIPPCCQSPVRGGVQEPSQAYPPARSAGSCPAVKARTNEKAPDCSIRRLGIEARKAQDSLPLHEHGDVCPAMRTRGRYRSGSEFQSNTKGNGQRQGDYRSSPLCQGSPESLAPSRCYLFVSLESLFARPGPVMSFLIFLAPVFLESLFANPGPVISFRIFRAICKSPFLCQSPLNTGHYSNSERNSFSVTTLFNLATYWLFVGGFLAEVKKPSAILPDTFTPCCAASDFNCCTPRDCSIGLRSFFG